MERPGRAASQGRRFDLLVVGGGIHGAWVARDAALRGLSVLLVEANDWGSGTSAKSSKLAHGGLRYLEQFEFGLVHEALQERERLLRIAPHLVRPLRFLYPIYPHVAGRRTVRAGLLLYDLLSHGRSLPGHRRVGAAEAARLVPGLSTEGLAGGATFHDAQFRSVERLVAELVWDAKRHGAVCLNHTRAVRLRLADSAAGKGVVGAVLAGTRDGAQGPEEWEVEAALTINAAGPWADRLLGAAGLPTRMRRTKGVHLAVPRFTDTALIVKAAADGRTFFILPWEGHCLVGTTDTDYAGDPAQAKADAADVAYLLAEARRYVPAAPLDRIRYTYAGVRALLDQPGRESDVTRRHRVERHRADGVTGLLSLQGGKLTTARRLAEQAVDEACRRLGRRKARRKRPTREAGLPGAPLVAWPAFRPAAVAAAGTELAIDGAGAAHLVDTYGARWRLVAACDGRPEALQPVHRGRPERLCEVTWAVREEDAATVADVMLRRTGLGLAPGGDLDGARRVASWMAGLLGWDAARQEAEWRAYAEEVGTLAVPALPAPPGLPAPPPAPAAPAAAAASGATQASGASAESAARG